MERGLHRRVGGGHVMRQAARGTTRGIWFGLHQLRAPADPDHALHGRKPRGGAHFRMLDKRDNSPVRFERVNSSTGKKVEWKDIVKG